MKKGEWVRIKRVVLDTSQRSDNLPEDTKQSELIMWTKGFLLADANIGDIAKVKTIIGREEEGEVIQHNPQYQLDYGNLVPELLHIGVDLRERLEAIDAN